MTRVIARFLDIPTSIGVLIMAAGALWAPHLSAVQDRASVGDGAYTEAQAGRGRDLYREKCASCHGPSLAGGETGPPLAGSAFLENWGGMPVADLFERISVSMPQETPGTLTPQQCADIVARILEANKFPAGMNELASDAGALKSLMIEMKPGAK